jgi:hypothetical protein
MSDRMDLSFRRLILVLFGYIFSLLFYIIFPNFKVLDIILEAVCHILNVKGKYPDVLEEVSYI